MKNALWKSMTDIRGEYIEEAAPDNQNAVNAVLTAKLHRQKKIIGWGALAAVLAVALIAASPLISRLISGDGVIVDDAYADYPKRMMTAYEEISPQLARVWTFTYEIDGKAEGMMFPEIEWGDETYSLAHSNDHYEAAAEEQLGDLLDEIEVTAFSSRTPVSATLDATLYAYKGIDPAYGVVVKLEGINEYFLYRSGKHADSLDELVEKADFRDLMTVSPNIFHTTHTFTGERVDLVFEGMTTAILWNELLAYGETVDYKGENDYYLRVSIGHELLQYDSVLCISADGYVTFGALKAGKAVYVGRERARAFLDYLEDHLTGYRLVEETAPSPSPNESPATVTAVRTTAAQPYNPAVPE